MCGKCVKIKTHLLKSASHVINACLDDRLYIVYIDWFKITRIVGYQEQVGGNRHLFSTTRLKGRHFLFTEFARFLLEYALTLTRNLTQTLTQTLTINSNFYPNPVLLARITENMMTPCQFGGRKQVKAIGGSMP